MNIEKSLKKNEWPVEFGRGMSYRQWMKLNRDAAPEWMRGLSTRLLTVILDLKLATKKSAVESLKNKKLLVGKTRNYGKKTDLELRRALGLSSYCPCCGQKIRL